MTQADITALRQRACSLVASLGDVLDTLQVIDRAIANPDRDSELHALHLVQQLDGAADAAEELAEEADAFAKAIDKHHVLARSAATSTPTVH